MYCLIVNQILLLDELQKQQQKFDESTFKEKKGMRYYVINNSMSFVSKLKTKVYRYNNRVTLCSSFHSIKYIRVKEFEVV